MDEQPKRVEIVRIPRASLDLVSSIAGFFGAALPDCQMAPGDGRGNAACIVGGDEVAEADIVRNLRRATRKLGKTLPKPIPEDEPLDDSLSEPMVLNRMEATETGVSFGIGGAIEEARALAAMLVSAFIPALEEMGAENYLTWDATDPDTGELYSVIMVKPGGLTPHQARERAEAEAERLRELCRANGIDPAAEGGETNG